MNSIHHITDMFWLDCEWVAYLQKIRFFKLTLHVRHLTDILIDPRMPVRRLRKKPVILPL